MKKINVVYTIDQAYQIPFCCSLSSLLEYNRNLIDRVYIIQNNESASSKEFEQTREFINSEHGLDIISIEIDDAQFMGLRADRHVSHATYYRLCLADFLPKEVQSVLLLDPDTIITKGLTLFSELSFMENSKLMCYAVDHGSSSVVRLNSLCPSLKNYFNAGVLFLNIQLLREEKLSETFINYGIEHKDDLLFWDQDILNIHFNKRWEELSYSYNAYGIKSKLKELPKIIHYTGNRKPWNYFCDHPYRQLFWRILDKTPFRRKLLFERILGGMLTWFLLPVADLRIRYKNQKK